MKFNFARFFFMLIASAALNSAHAQQNFFSDAPESSLQKANQKRVIIPEKYRTLQLDTAGMLAFMRTLPAEQNITNRNNTPVLLIPMPDGSMAKFHVWESSTMEPALAAAYPNIRTFTGQGIDDRTATIKLDWTEFGFHAMVLSPVTGEVFIDPYDQKTVTGYIAYFKKDFKNKKKFQEYLLPENSQKNLSERPANVLAGACIGSQLRTYRLALACTHQYAQKATALTSPTKAQTLAKVVITMNRVNGVYEKEVAIRMVLIANDTAILFNTAAGDPFTGNDAPTTLIVESQTQIQSRIGDANYDIGHTFSTGGGGVAILGCVCQNSIKAKGITGIDPPVGDAYDIDYVAHEMGHQFGASHTFNSLLDFCGASGQWSGTTNAEPGSGSTIMGYATYPVICSTDNLQNNSDDQFHAVSFDQITSFSASGNGSTCAVVSNTGNLPPVVNAGADYTIPISTFFRLDGAATDPNGDALTYCWDEIDVGGTGGTWNLPSGNAPLFRSFRDTIFSYRYFPKLSNQLSGIATIGEILPSYARTLHFRLTVRDNKAGGGGICSDEVAITVAPIGPFTVTYPSASGVIWNVNDFVTITWNPNGTTAAPINCANVSIQLSSDGGNTFPVTLVASTPNDGSYEIQVPNNVSAQSRIRIMAVGNIFYDISNTNFRIQNATAASFAFNNPVPVEVCAASSGTATLLSGALGTFSTPINLTASLNPAGSTVSFGSNPLTPGNSTTVVLNNTNSLAPGVYTVRVTGIAGAVTKTKDIQFIVGTPAPSTLSAPAAEATGLTTLPSFNWSAVSGAISYTLEISTVSDFSSVIQTISNITTIPYTLSTPLLENTTYYWRVKTVNSCGTGNGSAVPNRFRTGVSSCRTSTNVPITIPVNGTPRVTSTLTIPAAYGVTITDLNIIGLTATHSRVNDLSFILKAPSGDSVVVLNQVCSGSVGFNINLDDQAAAAVVCPPNTGAIAIPSNPLAAFNGLNSGGVWTLVVKDNTAGSGGSLTGWGLNINGAGGITCATVATPLATIYTFTGNGNWSDAANWSGNTVPPSTLPAGASIVIDHVVGGICTLNVAQTIAAGATLTIMTGKNLVVPGTLTVQ